MTAVTGPSGIRCDEERFWDQDLNTSSTSWDWDLNTSSTHPPSGPSHTHTMALSITFKR